MLVTTNIADKARRIIASVPEITLVKYDVLREISRKG
jgi:hypothetical protein